MLPERALPGPEAAPLVRCTTDSQVLYRSRCVKRRTLRIVQMIAIARVLQPWLFGHHRVHNLRSFDARARTTKGLWVHTIKGDVQLHCALRMELEVPI